MAGEKFAKGNFLKSCQHSMRTILPLDTKYKGAVQERVLSLFFFFSYQQFLNDLHPRAKLERLCSSRNLHPVQRQIQLALPPIYPKRTVSHDLQLTSQI